MLILAGVQHKVSSFQTQFSSTMIALLSFVIISCVFQTVLAADEPAMFDGEKHKAEFLQNCYFERIPVASEEQKALEIARVCRELWQLEVETPDVAEYKVNGDAKQSVTVALDAIENNVEQSQEPKKFQLAVGSAPKNSPEKKAPSYQRSSLGSRINFEKKNDYNPFALTAHNKNYILPYSYVTNPNEKVLVNSNNSTFEDLRHHEAKFQMSLKTALYRDLFFEDDSIFFAITAKSFWQVYNQDSSAPFRETNYEPELFWMAPINWKFQPHATNLVALGFSHQSNGESIGLSRSWNRIFAQFIWGQDRWAFSFKPWWRISEDEKDSPDDAQGDDNPDIEDYMGNFEFEAAYVWNKNELGFMFRNNLQSDNRGALQIDYSFPLKGKVRGYVQYFNGYGESLIDYDESIQRFGIGVLLTGSL